LRKGRKEKRMKMEYICVPKEIAKKYNNATSDNTKIEIIEDLTKKMKNEIEMSLSSLDDDVVQYKGMVLKYKKAFKEIYEDQAEKIYKTWEEIQNTLPKQDKLINKLKNELAPILEQIKKLSKVIENVNTYQLIRMSELIDKINDCDDKTKEVILKVIQMGKEDNNAD
jgi:hypothetical protein